MGNSFLNLIARKVVEAYIARNVVMAPVATQSTQIEPLIGPIEPPLMPIEAPLIPPSPVAEEGIFVLLPATPPNERVTEMDFKQASELDEINQRSMTPEPVPAESIDAIYNRYLTQFPIFPELSPRENSPQSDTDTQVLENVPITPPPEPVAPISPAQSDTFVMLDLSR